MNLIVIKADLFSHSVQVQVLVFLLRPFLGYLWTSSYILNMLEVYQERGMYISLGFSVKAWPGSHPKLCIVPMLSALAFKGFYSLEI